MHRTGTRGRRLREADAVQDQRVAGQNVEQQHPLENARRLVREPEADLRGLAAQVRGRIAVERRRDVVDQVPVLVVNLKEISTVLNR